MTSEVTYAEVRFKNGPSSAEPKAPPGSETPPLSRFQKCKPWFPWVVSGFFMLLSAILLVVIIVILKGSPKKGSIKSQFQKSTAWNCLLKRPEGKEPQLSCCMGGLEQFGSSCYHFSKDTRTWNKSREECMEKGFDLVIINSDAEQGFLTNHTQNSQVENFCIGLTDQKGTNQWHWVDETPLDPMLAFWRSKEPSNDDENCVVMHIGKGKGNEMKNNWNDVRCSVDEHHYVCETNTVFFSI
ncbi:C-type lectin domain family 4 member A [Lacerta agilis]|uniref:C-type lectin domain family 4 member A n=1 Tax=Lacerta agilis TaxID=80427 RepID=UPI00141A41E1|nr:C-type lectin domain family 4 member A [Lacerta agilis]